MFFESGNRLFAFFGWGKCLNVKDGLKLQVKCVRFENFFVPLQSNKFEA